MFTSLVALLALSSSVYALPTSTVSLVARDSAQDYRSCLSLRDICDENKLADPTKALSYPACLALVTCETPKYFFPDFPSPQPRLTLDAFHAASQGSDTITQQQYVDFYYGEIASIPKDNQTVTPEYPSSADVVIGYFSDIAAWTGYCSTRAIPYKNFADYIQYVETPGVCGAAASCDATVVATTPACVPQPLTDNGSCAKIVSECSIGAGSAHALFSSSLPYCTLAALCYSKSTVDVLILKLTKIDYLYTGSPLLSAKQPRLSTAVFDTLSKGKTYVSQQDIIDAYYSVLTNTINSAGGPPGAETPIHTGQNGPYPTDVSYVQGFWSDVAAWTGLCSSKNIPYQNLADYIQYSSTVKGAAKSC